MLNETSVGLIRAHSYVYRDFAVSRPRFGELPRFAGPKQERRILMAWTISIIVFSLWIVGVSAPYTLHGHIHLLLALAVAIAIAPVLFRALRKVT